MNKFVSLFFCMFVLITAMNASDKPDPSAEKIDANIADAESKMSVKEDLELPEGYDIDNFRWIQIALSGGRASFYIEGEKTEKLKGEDFIYFAIKGLETHKRFKFVVPQDDNRNSEGNEQERDNTLICPDLYLYININVTGEIVLETFFGTYSVNAKAYYMHDVISADGAKIKHKKDDLAFFLRL